MIKFRSSRFDLRNFYFIEMIATIENSKWCLSWLGVHKMGEVGQVTACPCSFWVNPNLFVLVPKDLSLVESEARSRGHSWRKGMRGNPGRVIMIGRARSLKKRTSRLRTHRLFGTRWFEYKCFNHPYTSKVNYEDVIQPYIFVPKKSYSF